MRAFFLSAAVPYLCVYIATAIAVARRKKIVINDTPAMRYTGGTTAATAAYSNHHRI